jgi:hypothetical protein
MTIKQGANIMSTHHPVPYHHRDDREEGIKQLAEKISFVMWYTWAL